MLDSELEERLEANTLYYKYTTGILVLLEVSFEMLELSSTSILYCLKYIYYFLYNKMKNWLHPLPTSKQLLLSPGIWDYWRNDFYFESYNLLCTYSLMHPTVLSLMLTSGFSSFPMCYLIHRLLLKDSFLAALSERIGTSNLFILLEGSHWRVSMFCNTREVLKCSGSCQ